MTDTHVKVSGVWKRVVRPHVKVGGVWKGVNNAYVKVSGVWKKAFTWVVYTLSGETVLQIDAVSPYDSRAGVRINADGTIDSAKSINGAALSYVQLSASTDWVIPNGFADADHDVRVTSVSHNGHAGWNSAAEADDTWIDLGTDRLWDIQSSSAEDINTTFDIEIRDASAATVATGAYTVRILNTV